MKLWSQANFEEKSQDIEVNGKLLSPSKCYPRSFLSHTNGVSFLDERLFSRLRKCYQWHFSELKVVHMNRK